MRAKSRSLVILRNDLNLVFVPIPIPDGSRTTSLFIGLKTPGITQNTLTWDDLQETSEEPKEEDLQEQ